MSKTLRKSGRFDEGTRKIQRHDAEGPPAHASVRRAREAREGRRMDHRRIETPALKVQSRTVWRLSWHQHESVDRNSYTGIHPLWIAKKDHLEFVEFL